MRYRLFLQGKTPSKIATILTEQGVPTPTGKEKWQGTTAESILTNEKYKGSALLQKKFTVDFLTKKQKVNEGEVPQYFVEKSLNAIINPSEFDMVQVELARRKELGKSIPVTVYFQQRLSAVNVVNFTAQRFGTATASTSVPFGNVIVNLKAIINATRHIYMSTI